MRKTSLLKIILFAVAIAANVDYLLFILNPAHAGNLGFFILTGIADTIAIVIFLSTWVTALYFELFKQRYYKEIEELRQRGSYLLREKVAVLVPVVNEDLGIVRNTLESLLALNGEKEIYLLDDGRKDATKELAYQMGVRYITRQDNRFFKAGNLNNGLRFVSEEFVIVVDADFALHPDFIQRTLPLFHDPKIAAVQTPQIYSNEETLFAKGSKYLQNLFYAYLQPGRNLIDSSFCVGTNVIYRRRALEQVGGISEISHSEDIFTTLKFLEKGYKIFYLNKQLAVGLAPTTLVSFYNQQFRWARGGLTMMFRHNTLLNRRLQIEQRLQFFLSNFFYLSGFSGIVYLISPLVAVLFSIQPISSAYFGEWLPKYAFFFCSNFIFFLILVKKNRAQSLLLGMYSFVPYICALLSVILGFQHFNWNPTNARAKGTITLLLSPYIVYLVVSLATGYFLLSGALNFNPGLIGYYFWLAIDFIIAATLVANAYRSKSPVSAPVFEGPLDQTDAMPAVHGMFGDLASIYEAITTQRLGKDAVIHNTTARVPVTRLRNFREVEEIPTMKARSLSRNGRG